MNEAGLVQQVVTSITRPRPDDDATGSIIDLIFTNCANAMVSVNTIPSPVSSDHNAVDIRFRSMKPQPLPSVLRTFLRVKQSDLNHLKNLLRLLPWDALLNADDPDICCATFTDLFHAAVKESIPSSRKRRSRCSPWITDELKKCITEKHSLFKKAKRSLDPNDWNKYKSVRNKVKALSKKLYWAYVNTLFTTKDNRRSFFAFVRSRKQSPPPPKFRYNDHLLSKPAEIASTFSSYFSSVFAPPTQLPPVPPPCPLPISRLSLICL